MRFFATLLEGSSCSVSMIWLKHQPTATNWFQVEIWIKQCSPTPTMPNFGAMVSMLWVPPISTHILDAFVDSRIFEICSLVDLPLRRMHWGTTKIKKWHQINHGQNSMAWSTCCLDKYLAQTVVLQPDCIYIICIYIYPYKYIIYIYIYIYISIHIYIIYIIYIYVKHIIYIYTWYIGWIRMIPPFIIPTDPTWSSLEGPRKLGQLGVVRYGSHGKAATMATSRWNSMFRLLQILESWKYQKGFLVWAIFFKPAENIGELVLSSPQMFKGDPRVPS